MDLQERQREDLDAVAAWAERIRVTLGPVMGAHGGKVHFRPGSKGVAMVGLLPDRPQRGKSGLRALDRVAQEFDALFAQHCQDLDQGRVTGEKALQSGLIAEPVTFDGPTEKWIVWPSSGQGVDPREDELAKRGIRLVGYALVAPGKYEFRVGATPVKG